MGTQQFGILNVGMSQTQPIGKRKKVEKEGEKNAKDEKANYDSKPAMQWVGGSQLHCRSKVGKLKLHSTNSKKVWLGELAQISKDSCFFSKNISIYQIDR